MMTQGTLITVVGMILCCLGGGLLNVFFHPLLKLAGLFLSYVGAAILLLNVCSLQMCLALLVCGIGVTVLFGTAQRENPAEFKPINSQKEWFFFRLLLAVMLGVLAYTSTELLRYWIPVRQSIQFVMLWIAMLGIFGLTLDDEMLFRGMYLQSICLSFTICYIYMENSILVFGFFAIINLLLAFGGTVLALGGNQPTEELQS